MTELGGIEPGMPVVVGDRVVEMPETAPGDRILAVHATGDLLVIGGRDLEVVRDAVSRADAAFRALADVDDDDVTAFFEGFADRLSDDGVWSRIGEANASDIARAKQAGRSVTRLTATEGMREAMIEGLRGWAKAPSRRGEVIERQQGADWTVERRRVALGVVAFVFEGRPNVFADGAGVVRGGNASVMRIGSDALRTAGVIEALALAPALEEAGLPEATVSLVRSPSHGAAHALFTMPEVRLAVARGSGTAVSLLGAIATQHGIPASLHGTGGAWVYLADDAPERAVRHVVVRSLDRKVCNTLNTVVVAAQAAHRLVPLVLEALGDRDPAFRLHVAASATHEIPAEHLDRRVTVHRAHGEVVEPQVDVIPDVELSTEWEWERTPEVSLVCARDDLEAVELIDRYSPRFVASILTADTGRFERFVRRVDAPYVGNAFTRWVDGQWAWGRPELGLTNWERGRLMGRSGILTGEDVFSVREVFVDHSGEATQER